MSAGKLTFGFDIGIASVGWAVLNENRIVDLGVRAFDKAEVPKTGESLNLARRQARLLRRRLARRAWRLTKLARLMKRQGLIADTSMFSSGMSAKVSIWQLRVDGLDRKLNNEEWARVIYHLCKHRGFHWASRAEERAAESDAEGGRVKQGLAGTKRLMVELGYRSAAEMALAEFPDAQRNKRGDYSKALSRELIGTELHLLFACQRMLGNPHAGADFEELLATDDKRGLFWVQQPALSGAALLKMLGCCTFEKTEYRAPKASFSAERHVWLTKLNNLRITLAGVTRPLNEAERNAALSLPYMQGGDLSYKQLRTALAHAGVLSGDYRFAGLRYSPDKDVESTKLVGLPAWQTLSKTLKAAGLDAEWHELSAQALSGNPATLDQIAWVLSAYKEDGEVVAELARIADLPNKARLIDALLEVRFDKFSSLSLCALRKIVPMMEQGLRYDEAVARIPEYGHHSQLHGGEQQSRLLLPLYAGRDKHGRMLFNEDLDVPRNPVVLRSLNQARKVINALIGKYGPPHAVHIELARDLSRPFDERQKITREQEAYRERNTQDRAEFAGQFNLTGQPKGRDFEKWQLYREQQGKCAYSLTPIDVRRLLEPGYVEIDHALAYSRSFDDSKNNRVLALTAENRNKGNRTPYEYLDGAGNSERWLAFAAFVESNPAYRTAKRNRLLRRDFGEREATEFKERNLGDTRYICKFFKNYVEHYLCLHEESDAKRCVVVSGQLTAFLRARWGLVKSREASDRHHALDAVVVAACSHGMVKRLSDYSRRKELEWVRAGFVDVETGEVVNPALFHQLSQHFPEPWPHFRDELQVRLNCDDVVKLREELARLGSYTEGDLQAVRPLFVSRAVQRRNGGAAHKDTIYAQPERLKAQGSVTQKIPVVSLALADMDDLVDPHRNAKLYAALRDWLMGRDAREKRAKAIEAGAGRGKSKRELTQDEQMEIASLRALPRKPDKQGNPTGPVVRTVTKVISKMSGIPVRGGIAKNNCMLRVDVFSKGGKFYLVPVYVHHRVAGLPMRAIVALKDEAEWTHIDNSFEFRFSLYSNDLVSVRQSGKSAILCYYAGCDRSTGCINLWAHDRNQAIGKAGLIRGIGIKTALSIEKLHVDILGGIHSAQPEVRRGLA